MNKLRIERQKGYTVLPNSVVFDKALSLGALGLLGKMLALPDGWEFSVAGLSAMCDCGKDRIRSCLVNIEAAGYLLREQERGEGGKFINTYVLFDAPQAHRVGLSDADNPCRETRRNINNNNTIPPISPQGGKRARRETKSAPDWKPERFSKLWDYYPHDKRGCKQKAIAAWDRLSPSDELIDQMAHSLGRLLATIWSEVGTPHVSTFLNQRRWEDVGNLDGGGVQSDHFGEAVRFGWQ